MSYREIAVEPRNVAWLAIPGDLLHLRVWSHGTGTLVELHEPSDALAQAALYEAAVRYARQTQGYSAPPLVIEAIPKP